MARIDAEVLFCGSQLEAMADSCQVRTGMCYPRFHQCRTWRMFFICCTHSTPLARFRTLKDISSLFALVISWKLQQADVHYAFLRLVLTDLTGGYPNDRARLREGFLKHYDEVRSLIPQDNLLEHRPQDGWGPLCNFLDRPIPKEPYPRVNEGDALFALHKKVFWILLGSLFVTRILPLAVIIVAVWYGYLKKVA